MLLYSWNVNGFRALLTKGHWSWFAEKQPDIAALQEVKAEEEQIPEEHRCPAGYQAFWHHARKKKGYSGVACFSKPLPQKAVYCLPGEDWRGEGRLIHLEYEKFHFMNVYFPNGQMSEERLAYKMGYYDAFLDYAQDLRRQKPIVVCGDFNTAHKEVDIARPKANEGTSGFLPIERAWMDKFVDHGYVDTFRHIHGPQAVEYSWWSMRFKARERNVGWRIDYFFVSRELLPAVKDAWIEQEVHGSDHCPIGLRLDPGKM